MSSFAAQVHSSKRFRSPNLSRYDVERIARMLLQHPRYTYSEIARRCRLSETTIARIASGSHRLLQPNTRAELHAVLRGVSGLTVVPQAAQAAPVSEYDKVCGENEAMRQCIADVLENICQTLKVLAKHKQVA